MPSSILKFLSSVFGASGIALGAFGAHALKAKLEQNGHAGTWETAVLYHLIHAIALLALAAAPSDRCTERLRTWTAASWATGVVLFSGSLYVLSLGGPRWLGPVTPLGGVALILGWVLVGVSALKPPEPKR